MSEMAPHPSRHPQPPAQLSGGRAGRSVHDAERWTSVTDAFEAQIEQQ